MSVEIHDGLIALLAEVATLKEKEAHLKAEKARQQEAIATAEGEVNRCNTELDDIREAQLKAKRSMDALRDQLFRRDDDEAIVEDNTHVPTDGSAPSTETDAKRMWKERQRHLKQVP
jgi:hypothetical protein